MNRESEANEIPGGARTSLTHPLRIATLECGKGRLGVTFAPGKQQARAMTGAWARDLDADLRTIRDWGAGTLLSLIEPWEFEELGISALAERAAIHGLHWVGLPITDGDAPDDRFLVPWKQLGPELVAGMRRGEGVVVHCKGGLGRAGTVACLLLLDSESVTDADEAMRLVRAVRPKAIETVAQEEFLRAWHR